MWEERAHSRGQASGERGATGGERQPLQPQPQPEAPTAFSVLPSSTDALFTSLGPQHTQPQSQLVTFSAVVRSSLGIDVIGLLLGLFVRSHTKVGVQAGLKASAVRRSCRSEAGP
jgi:hypothetical protein